MVTEFDLSATCEKSSSMTPYESMNILLSKDDTV